MSRPGRVVLDLMFGVKGLGKPGTVTLDLSFSVNSPDPTVYVFDRGDWQPGAQRVWAGDAGWFPPTV